MSVNAVAARPTGPRTADILVSPSWLASKRRSPDDADVVVLDGSWHMPSSGRNAGKEFAERHIPAARFFDIDAVKDQSTDLPHMLPSAGQFADAVAKLGVRPTSHVIIYDTAGIFSACRVYWTFRVFNHPGTVSVLNGGLPSWVAEGHPVEASDKTASKNTADASEGEILRRSEELKKVYKLRKDLVRTYDEIRANLGRAEGDREQILDARSSPRFAGKETEPRPGVQAGHMPHSVSIPYGELLVNETHGSATPWTRFAEPAKLAAVFQSKGVRLEQPLVTSCGSGITASVLFVGLELAGATGPLALYDGSWAEYGSRKESEILQG